MMASKLFSEVICQSELQAYVRLTIWTSILFQKFYIGQVAMKDAKSMKLHIKTVFVDEELLFLKILNNGKK